MDDPSYLAAVIAELQTVHGCHTVLLYGSRARGDATAESDWDVAGLRDSGPRERDARLLHGRYLDAFIYPAADLDALGEEVLKLVGGRVLVEQGGAGARWLRHAEALHARGAPAWPADERAARRAWVAKTLARVRRGDVEAHFRRAWLLTDLLEMHFRLRGMWYRGPKESLAWLAAHDPPALARFAAALEPGAPLDAIEALAAVVLA